ncbi:hypothetical protein ANRL4_03071 [Anaerolineae bacterium]|nr:hypothetical protein ANRL4_03071 [Anaerolineae bacterium]
MIVLRRSKSILNARRQDGLVKGKPDSLEVSAPFCGCDYEYQKHSLVVVLGKDI